MAIQSRPRIAFTEVPNDPLGVKIHRLRNGLTLFLSINEREPRIHANIVVQAGAKQDPADTTGLAHYMEHLLFKGSSRIGALDWDKEALLLEKIAELYEQHRQAPDEAARLHIYAEIDRLSGEAAKLAAPNEYDLLSTAIGAKDTNAYTSVDQTVYVNDIPANELKRWMELESERFRMMALRLFHTELETVYEEFNISQDQDVRKVNRNIKEILFPNHPYGRQSVIGSAEHLRKPSQRKIQEYFRTYYVPNNMAIVLSGDFDPMEAVALAEQYFGGYEPRAIPPFDYEAQPVLRAPVRRDVYGRDGAFVDIAWRFNGAATDDPMMLAILQNLLYNQQAGLLDLNLNQQQRVLQANAWVWVYQDYAALGLVARPREGQSLPEAEALLMQEVQRLRDGDFGEWMLEAALRDLRLREIKNNERNEGRVGLIAHTFALGIDWARMARRFEWWAEVDKADVTAFARKYLGEGRAVVYKHQGEDPSVIKVDKPPITAVRLNADAVSEYGQAFLAQTPPLPIAPVFIDFKQAMKRVDLQPGLPLAYVHNAENELFRLDYVFTFNKRCDPRLALAISYLAYLGTPRYSAAELQRQFFRLGISFDLHTNNDYTYLTISGLSESMPEGLRLMEHLLEAMQPDEAALQSLVADVLRRRADNRQNRNFLLRQVLSSYARYGLDSPFNYRLSESGLKAVTPEELIELLQGLNGYEHRIHYYGPDSLQEVERLLQTGHRRPSQLQPTPAPKIFEQRPTSSNEVLLMDFPTVQTDVMLISRGRPDFSLEEFQMSEWYNEYFGYGLSSIVFQEIRESRALAYSAFAYYSSPDRLDQAHYMQAYLGTQPDKLPEAIPALKGILQDMPWVPGQAASARHSILRRIESERIPPDRFFWESLSAERLAHDRELREGLYHRLMAAGLPDLKDFHEARVKGRAYTHLLLGPEQRMDRALLESIGPVRVVALDELLS